MTATDLFAVVSPFPSFPSLSQLPLKKKKKSGAALIPLVFLAGLVAAVFFRQAWGALIIAFFAAAIAAPAGAISQRFRHARVWDCWRRYFRLRAACPEIPYIDPSRRYIVVQTPHSVFPMG